MYYFTIYSSYDALVQNIISQQLITHPSLKKKKKGYFIVSSIHVHWQIVIVWIRDDESEAGPQ